MLGKKIRVRLRGVEKMVIASIAFDEDMDTSWPRCARPAAAG